MDNSTSFYQTPIDLVLPKLERVRRAGSAWTASCPVAEHGQGQGDLHPSLSIRVGTDGQVLMHCFAGCATEEIVAALGLNMRDLFPANQQGRRLPPESPATLQPTGCTLEEYAAAKHLPLEFLQGLGLANQPWKGRPCVRIPYRDEHGSEVAIRYRLRLDKTAGGDQRFAWKTGTKPCLYGLNRLPPAREGQDIVLVEGESDCHTAWLHGIPALGLPGAGQWREDRDAPMLEGFGRIFVVLEPDAGGEAVLRRLQDSRIRERVWLVRLGDYKDLSQLHLECDEFERAWAAALAQAQSWQDYEANQRGQDAQVAWEQCKDLATQPDILATVADTLEAEGVVGERRVLELLYLIVTSRLLPRPVSASLKGPSSAGKSYVLERVLAYFPSSAYYALTAMSERALIYDEEPVTHRYLVIYEAVGISSDISQYLVRSLLSEGEINYTTVEKTAAGMRSRHVHRDGPTGLLTTTTKVSLHPENETRMLSIPVTDTPEQTKRIMLTLAEDRQTPEDHTAWHALQQWLELQECEVVIPWASTLADMTPPVAVRLRRDFGLVLALVSTHAILHQASRERDDQGRIMATPADYEAVYDLVAEFLAAGVETSVPPTVRETVRAVQELLREEGPQTVGDPTLEVFATQAATVSQISARLRLDKSAGSRRVQTAIALGYLQQEDTRRGRASRIVLGDPLPEDHVLLPAPADLLKRCSVAADSEGNTHHPDLAEPATTACATDDQDPTVEQATDEAPVARVVPLW